MPFLILAGRDTDGVFGNEPVAWQRPTSAGDAAAKTA
jgi:hypothetical protein